MSDMAMVVVHDRKAGLGLWMIDRELPSGGSVWHIDLRIAAGKMIVFIK
jgi:hypothetical protein